MKLAFLNPVFLVHLDHTSVAERQNVEIRPALLLFLLELFHSALQGLAEILNAREKGGDFGENDQGIANLEIIAALQAVDDGFGDLEMPFVTNVTIVLKVEMIFLRRGVGRSLTASAAAEHRLEAWVVGAFRVVDLLSSEWRGGRGIRKEMKLKRGIWGMW